ncbi:MAG: hypothetical protein Q9P44_05020 [Anaerolineae bacterium]|nr:hypothetical protein [Anaerolineae bacterium]
MLSTEETKPNRSDIMREEDYADNEPGCVVWGIVGIFGIFLSFAIVLVAGEAGVRQGADAGAKTAVAREQEFIARECEILPTQIAREQVELVGLRYDTWMQQGAIPLCAQPYIAQATQIYLNSLATATPMPSATLEATATSFPTELPTATAEIPIENAAPTSIYDLAGLLQEARDDLFEGNTVEAIRSLDAIIAIDPDYETATVNQLLFTSLTNRATFLYRSDGSLAEAIQLTNRAENYGDVQDLAFERTVAQYYLDAQGFLDVNYAAAIQQLNQVRAFASNYRNTNQLLFEQYIGYGDAFVVGGEPCRAVQQYDAALAMQQQPSLQIKRDEVQAQCNGTGLVATLDPNSTIDPNQPTATPTTGIAPVGQPGG